MNSLPNEITLKTFSFLSIPDLIRCSSVCTSWHRIANDNALWKKFIPDLPKDHQERAKEYLAKHFVHSENDIITFCNNIRGRNFQETSFRLFSLTVIPAFSKILENITNTRFIKAITLPTSRENLRIISLKVSSAKYPLFKGVLWKLADINMKLNPYLRAIIVIVSTLALARLMIAFDIYLTEVIIHSFTKKKHT